MSLLPLTLLIFLEEVFNSKPIIVRWVFYSLVRLEMV
jgi:hypothetical protein